jgi:hypothetical protein
MFICTSAFCLALHPAGLLLQQHLALAHHGAYHAHLVARPPGGAQETQAHQLLQPLAVLHVALAPGHVLHLARIDQPDLQAVLLEHLVHRNPVHPGGFQCHRVHAAREQPVGHRVQVVGHRAELAHRLVGQMRRHCHPVARCADINARGIGKHLVFSLAHGHGLLQNS